MNILIHLLRSLFFLSVLLTLSLPTQASSKAHGISIIANIPSTAIYKRELQFIYTTQQKKWANGQSVQVFTFPPDSIYFYDFCVQKLGHQPYQLERFWNRLVFTGTGKGPNRVSSIQEMKSKVMNTPGSIGYLPDNVGIPKQYILEVKE